MPKETPVPSPGNAFSDLPIKMRVPNMNFIYRLDCEMAKENHIVGAPFGGSHTRIIMPIVGGTVKGPRITGTIVERSGADWGTAINDNMLLNARYTLKTDDGHYIYVKSKGIFKPGAGQGPVGQDQINIDQDRVDWFTRLQFETGPGPYEWLSGVFGIGVLAMHEGRILIDAYELSNFMPQL